MPRLDAIVVMAPHLRTGPLMWICREHKAMEESHWVMQGSVDPVSGRSSKAVRNQGAGLSEDGHGLAIVERAFPSIGVRFASVLSETAAYAPAPSRSSSSRGPYAAAAHSPDSAPSPDHFRSKGSFRQRSHTDLEAHGGNEPGTQKGHRALSDCPLIGFQEKGVTISRVGYPPLEDL